MAKRKRQRVEDKGNGGFQNTLAAKLSGVKVKKKMEPKAPKKAPQKATFQGYYVRVLGGEEPPKDEPLREWEDQALFEASKYDPEMNALRRLCLQRLDQLEQERAAEQRHHEEVRRQLMEQVAAAQRQQAEAQAALEAVQAALEQERERSARFLEEREAARQERDAISQAFETQTLSELFSQRSLPEARHAEALMCLLHAQPEGLLSLLRVPPQEGLDFVKKYLALSCGDPMCDEELSRASSRQILQVRDASMCDNCQGSDLRRSFNRMVRICRENRRYKMIIVGGSPDGHKEIMRYVPDGFILRIVSGKERRDKQQAADDLRHADIVVVWGPTILPHKISELYTKQQKQHPDKVVFVMKRGISSFAQEVCAFFEEPTKA